MFRPANYLASCRPLLLAEIEYPEGRVGKRVPGGRAAVGHRQLRERPLSAAVRCVQPVDGVTALRRSNTILGLRRSGATGEPPEILTTWAGFTIGFITRPNPVDRA